MTEDEERKEEQRKELAAYELANGIVPGTAVFRDDRPTGGTTWEGKARMAQARVAAGVPLNDVDRQALDRIAEVAS